MARRVPKEEAATIGQVEDAIVSLSDGELRRLDTCARHLIVGLGSAAKGRSHEDLRQEAILAVLNDTRRWDPTKVDFVRFLCWAMKSIASAWRGKSDRSDGSEILCAGQTSQTTGSDPLSRERDSRTSAEDAVIAKDQVEAFERHFEADPLVSEVLAGMFLGLSGPEVMELSGATENEYRAAVRRLRREAKRRG